METTWGGAGGNLGGGSGGGRTPGRGPADRDQGATKEGGARDQTGGTQSRRSTAGPRPQPWWWPTVEPTEGGDMEEGWRLQGANQWRWSRRWRSLRRRANEPGGCWGSRGPGWSWGLWWLRRRSRDPRQSRSDSGPMWSWREEGAQRSRLDGAMRRSQRRWRRGILQPWWRWRMPVPRGSHRTDRGLRASGGDARKQPWKRQDRVGIFEERALSRIGHWRIGSPLRAGRGDQRQRRAGWDQQGWRRKERGQVDLPISFPVYQVPFQIQQPQMHNPLTLGRGAGPLCAHIVHGLLPRGGHYRRLSHLVWRVGLDFGVILCSVAPLCAGSRIIAGNGSPSSVGSGWCSAPWGDGGLGSGSGVDLARSSTGKMLRSDPRRRQHSG